MAAFIDIEILQPGCSLVMQAIAAHLGAVHKLPILRKSPNGLWSLCVYMRVNAQGKLKSFLSTVRYFLGAYRGLKHKLGCGHLKRHRLKHLARKTAGTAQPSQQGPSSLPLSPVDSRY